MNIKSGSIYRAALALLLLPPLLFTATHLPPLLSVAGCALLLLAAAHTFRHMDEHFPPRSLRIGAGQLAAVAAMVAAATIFSGIGGAFPQSGDHIARNPVFSDLITHGWPVVYNSTNSGLAYYYGYFLLPSLLGKLGGALGADAWAFANAALAVQTMVYCFVVQLLLADLLRLKDNSRYFCLLPLLFFGFSGLHIVGAVVFPMLRGEVGVVTPLEWYNTLFAYNGIYTAFAYTYNQLLPAVLATLMFARAGDARLYALLGLALVVTSPIPLMGLALMMLARAAFIYRADIFGFLKHCASLQNLAMLGVSLPAFAFYMGHSKLDLEFWNPFTGRAGALHFILFSAIEFGLLALLLFRRNSRDPLFHISVAMLCAIPFIRIAGTVDFALRVSTAPLLYLMLLFMEEVRKRRVRRALVVAYATLCIFSNFVRLTNQWADITNTGKLADRMDSLYTLENRKTVEPHWFVPQYVKRNAAFDRFFGMSDVSRIWTPDIILSEDGGSMEVVYRQQDIALLEGIGIRGLDRVKASSGSLYMTEKLPAEYEIPMLDMSSGWAMEAKLPARVPINAALARRSPQRVDITLRNNGAQTLWDSAFTARSRGVYCHAYAQGGGLEASNLARIESSVKPGQGLDMVLALERLPQYAGSYRLVFGLYEGEIIGPGLCELEVEFYE